MIRSFSDKQKGDFLKFVTCNERPPLLGFKELRPQFSIQKPDDIGPGHLPHAATCFNTLRLPQYPSEKVLKEKLLEAISNVQGFYNL